MQITEGRYAGCFIVSEANVGATGVSRSRDTFTIPTNGNIVKVGTVVRITAAGVIIPWALGDADPVIMYDNLGVTTETTDIVGLVRDCEVNGDELYWGAAIEADPASVVTAIAELKAYGIVVR